MSLVETLRRVCVTNPSDVRRMEKVLRLWQEMGWESRALMPVLLDPEFGSQKARELFLRMEKLALPLDLHELWDAPDPVAFLKSLDKEAFLEQGLLMQNVNRLTTRWEECCEAWYEASGAFEISDEEASDPFEFSDEES